MKWLPILFFAATQLGADVPGPRLFYSKAFPGSVPAYVPIVRGGGKMHVRMLCLGRHWNGKTYQYEPTRTDFDNLPTPPLRRGPSGIVLG